MAQREKKIIDGRRSCIKKKKVLIAIVRRRAEFKIKAIMREKKNWFRFTDKLIILKIL
jgi:hypothetical protein